MWNECDKEAREESEQKIKVTKDLFRISFCDDRISFCDDRISFCDDRISSADCRAISHTLL